jgi:dCMP deaminase
VRVTQQEFLMRVAIMASERSTCTREGGQNGCVIADHELVHFVTGYNGGYAGGPNHCRHPDAVGKCGCAHAEMNAIARVATLAKPLHAFVTSSPCMLCAVLLINVGCASVTYGRQYRDLEGLDVLEEAGVELGWWVPQEISESLELPGD